MIAVVAASFRQSPSIGPYAAQRLINELRREGHTAELFDSSLDDLTDERVVARIGAATAVVFLSILNVRGLLEEDVEARDTLATQLRRAGFVGPIVVCGHRASLDPSGTLAACSAIDHVVVGSPADPIVHLMRHVIDGVDQGQHGRIMSRVPSEFVAAAVLRIGSGDVAVDERPYLERLVSLHPPDLLAEVIETSRGCSHSGCSFCSTPDFYRLSGGRRFELRDMRTVVEECIRLRQRYGVSRIVFEDDSFCYPGRHAASRLAELADAVRGLPHPIEFSLVMRADAITPSSLIELRHLKRRGLRLIYLGLESFADQDLCRYNKAITGRENVSVVKSLESIGFSMDVAARLRLKPGMLPLSPFTTLERIESQFPLWDEMKLTPVKMLARVELYKGTALWRQAADMHLLDEGGGPSSYRFKDPRTSRFVAAALDGLRLIHGTRKRIRSIEKTAAGLMMPLDATSSIRRHREDLETLFRGHYRDSLSACMSEDGEQALAQRVREFARRGGEMLDDPSLSADVAASWRVVGGHASEVYRERQRRVPTGVEPPWFQPVWFPTIH